MRVWHASYKVLKYSQMYFSYRSQPHVGLNYRSYIVWAVLVLLMHDLQSEWIMNFRVLRLSVWVEQHQALTFSWLKAVYKIKLGALEYGTNFHVGERENNLNKYGSTSTYLGINWKLNLEKQTCVPFQNICERAAKMIVSTFTWAAMSESQSRVETTLNCCWFLVF